ncbi:hypothetical protein SDRG_03601 [Saprolegnia diclina VS20]|uniref:Uncharacterized protein n=1 Tax=Saprolegnia diclina (strain VS20) TaxID=1156394 RepID=T0QMT1_SAPDV|nr:hypothetical protein SDRG_03601 [Saprolegnia diclina VS20]EQC39399.1 hypothetical protein SDRG_03601 [Saprolegnia diclina VS20]|eukprot:XP_008607460.1 hypothetical protein SDRG_03601 [Saprolegnia diclina VS20]
MLDAVGFVGKHSSAANVVELARRILASMGTEIDLAVETLFPVAMHIDVASPAFVPLANAFVDSMVHLRDGDAPYALPFIALSPPCCALCVEFGTFLLSPDDDGVMVLHSDLHPPIEATVAAHRDLLVLEPTTDGSHRVIKLQQALYRESVEMNEFTEPVHAVVHYYAAVAASEATAHTTHSKLKPLLDTLHFVCEYCTGKAEAVANAIASHLTDPDEAREILYPVVVRMEKASPAFAVLATAYLDTVSYLRDSDNHYALPFITLDEAPNCCSQYKAFAVFLLAPDVAEMQLPFDACPRIHAIIRRYRTHFEWVSTDEGDDNDSEPRLVKRRPPHHRGRPAAHLVEAYARDAAMAARVHALLQDSVYSIRELFNDA